MKNFKSNLDKKVISKKKAALKRLVGAGKELKGVDYKKAITEYLEKKYL